MNQMEVIFMNNLVSAFKSMIRNLSMTLASLLLITLTLMVVGFVCVLSINTNHIATDVIDNLSISVFVDNGLDEAAVEALGEQIKAVEGVESMIFSSKDDELKTSTTMLGEDGGQIYNFFKDENPLSDVFIVSLHKNETDFEAIAGKIEELDGVTSAMYGGDSGANGLISSMIGIQYVSIAVSVILFLVSIFLITNTIKLNITARYKEIEIMRLVGATKTYIRAPFFVEGVTIGLISAIIAFCVIAYGYHYLLLTPTVSKISNILLDSHSITVILVFGLPVIGMVIGGIGSLFAVRKHLRT